MDGWEKNVKSNLEEYLHIHYEVSLSENVDILSKFIIYIQARQQIGLNIFFLFYLHFIAYFTHPMNIYIYIYIYI